MNKMSTLDAIMVTRHNNPVKISQNQNIPVQLRQNLNIPDHPDLSK